MKISIAFNGTSVSMQIGDKEALAALYNHEAIGNGFRHSAAAGEYLDSIERELENGPIILTTTRNRFERFVENLCSMKLSLDENVCAAFRSMNDGGKYFAITVKRLAQEWTVEHTRTR